MTEGQCQAHAVAPGTPVYAGNQENQVWLHWDVASGAMAVCGKRNWAAGNDGPLKGAKAPPLSSSLLTVLIGLLAQDGDAVYFAPRLLGTFIERRHIGEAMIRRAVRTLLQTSAVSPAKLARSLEKDIRLLPALWPMLTECVKTAGALVAAGKAPPVWANRILDMALRAAPYLAEAVNAD